MGEYSKQKEKQNALQSASNSDKGNGLTLSPPAMQLNATRSQKTIQQKDGEDEGNSLSYESAKKIIISATRGLGTDEAAIYDALRRCPSRKNFIYDATVIKALNGDMEGHELWKCHLLMEYGSESNFPAPINELWKATKGAGTDESAVYAALEKMDKQAKTSYGLKYILQCELSGEELQKALDLITVKDSIDGNIFGGKEEGKENLVVDHDNLRQLIDAQFVGAASKGLEQAMMTLYGNPPEGKLLDETLARIEAIRGLPKGAGKTQFDIAKDKRKKGEAYYKKKKEDAGQVYDPKKDHPSPDLDTSKHDTFTASNAQLRFGKIVGDVFGIDAVFGSLISPTGGMAGPGNERIPILKDGGAVATHGAIHDAAGYLYNCHGIGPGYDYLQSEVGSDPSNPLAGQTNMDWFIKEYDKTDNDVQWFERILNSKAHIGAAFSKQYEKLNTEQKKEALKVMADTSTLMLKVGGISNTDRKNKITELMDSCNASEKTEIADYFYNNDGFHTISSIFKLMRPHVSKEVYQQYWERKMEDGID